jgi:hypothetical protein
LVIWQFDDLIRSHAHVEGWGTSVALVDSSLTLLNPPKAEVANPPKLGQKLIRQTKTKYMLWGIIIAFIKKVAVIFSPLSRINEKKS